MWAGAASVAGLVSQREHGDGWEIQEERDHAEGECQVTRIDLKFFKMMMQSFFPENFTLFKSFRKYFW